jgi:hypothetical protein
MERVLHQPEGRAGKRLQGISERHGAEGSVRFGKWETQKIGAHRVGCCFGRQSVAAAAEQVLDGSAQGSDVCGKRYCDQVGQQIRLFLGRCSAATGIAPHLHFAGD